MVRAIPGLAAYTLTPRPNILTDWIRHCRSSVQYHVVVGGTVCYAERASMMLARVGTQAGNKKDQELASLVLQLKPGLIHWLLGLRSSHCSVIKPRTTVCGRRGRQRVSQGPNRELRRRRPSWRRTPVQARRSLQRMEYRSL